MDHLLRTTPSPTQAGDWALVLAAAGLEHRVVEQEGQFAILVGLDDEPAAAAALKAFDAENVPPRPIPAPDAGGGALGVLCTIAFAAMFWVTGARDGGSPWFGAGSASAELIAKGQWWRAVTALTLHADLSHLFGNVVASLLFVSAVGRWLGAGLGAAVILVSAMLANLLTAAVHRTGHVSVGASTATFAALGIVAGLQIIRRWRHGVRRRYFWLPLGAGLALFAMLGVGSNSEVYAQLGINPDVYAHLFGLGVGAVAGVGLAISRFEAPRGWLQILLGAGTLVAVGFAWLLAFGWRL